METIIDGIRRSTRGLRLKRMQLFLRIMKPSNGETILDIGGYPELWRQCGYQGSVDLLNLSARENFPALPPHYRYIQGDGRCLDFGDKRYDIVFSNSVIEHVGGWASQEAFAHEASRVGKRYWIQTPNKNFPIEPHLNLPLVQFLPLSMRKRVAAVWPFSFVKRWGMDTDAFIGDLRPLTIGEMQTLFPDGRVWKERLFGFVKSIVAYRC